MGGAVTKKKSIGRPSKYNNHTMRKFKAYIQQCEEINELGEKVKLPTVNGLAIYLSVNKKSLYQWAKQVNGDNKLVHPEFSNAFNNLEYITEEILVNNSLSGHFKSVPAIASLKNLCGWVEKHEINQNITANIRVASLSLDMTSEQSAQAYKALLGN